MYLLDEVEAFDQMVAEYERDKANVLTKTPPPLAPTKPVHATKSDYYNPEKYVVPLSPYKSPR